jgi:hypothetical protein
MTRGAWFAVIVLDSDGCDISRSETQGKANAIASARCYLTDPEYAPIVRRLEVRDPAGVIVWDFNSEVQS